MEGTRVAARYAKSFIDLAIEQGALEQAYTDMKYIAEVCASTHEFVIFLKSPIIKTGYHEVLDGLLSKIMINSVDLILFVIF